MKIYLASILESDNFGSGRLVGIFYGKKPSDLKIDYIFKPFTPSIKLTNEYYDEYKNDHQKAASIFVSGYEEQLDACLEDLTKVSKEEDKSIIDILPFCDGDTLVSWERAANTHYREQLAIFLKRLGFEVVSN